MAAPVDYRETGPALTALGSVSQVREPFGPDQDYADHTAGAAETAGAMWMLNSTIGETIDAARTNSEFSQLGRDDSSFNPYTYFAENKKQLDETMPSLEYFVRKGDLHGTRSPDEFMATAHSIQRELDRRDTVSRGGYVGLGLGMLAQFADVSTAVPVIGAAGKVGTLAKIGIGAANMAVQGAAQEAYLQANQHARTMQESLDNIGIGTLLGGGVGAFHGILSTRNVLHPSNPKNVLLDSTAVPTIQMESLSAAASGEKTVNYAEGQGLGWLDKANRTLGMPAAIALKSDPSVAAIMENISRSGMVTKENEAGIPNFADDAEGILNTDYRAKALATVDRLDQLWSQVNVDMGTNAVGARDVAQHIPGLNRLVDSNPVTKEDWEKHLSLSLQTPDYKTGNAALDKGLAEATQHVRTFFDHYQARGEQLGLFTPEQRLDNYFVQKWLSHKINDNPNEFEKMLLEKFVKRPDTEWLKETHDLTPAEFDKLPDTVQGRTDKYKAADGTALEVPAGTKPPNGSQLVERAITKREVLKNWSEETSDDRLNILEKKAAAAEERSRQAEYEFRKVFKEARKLDKTAATTKLMEAKAVVREASARLEAMRQKKAQLEAEARALAEAATAARQHTLAHQLQVTEGGHVPKEQLKSAAFKHGTQIFEGESHADAMQKAIDSGIPEEAVGESALNGGFGFTTTHNKFYDAEAAIPVAHHAGQMGEGDLVLTSDTLKRFPPKATLENLEAALGVTHPEDPALTVQRAAQEARARTVADELGRVDRRLRAAEERYKRLSDAAAAREQAAYESRIARKRAADDLRSSKAFTKSSRIEARKAGSRLLAASKRVPVSEQVAEITRTLQNHGESPSGMLLFKPGSDEKITASGRVKHRGIDLTPAELKEFIDKGYLDTNVSQMIHSYTRDVGGRLAMLEKFGNVDLKPQAREVQDLYAAKKAAAPNAAARDKLAAEEKQALETITVLRNRVLGIDGIPDNPASFLMYMNRTMRQVNFLRAMGGSMLSSITDTATSALSNGGMGRTLGMFGRSVLAHAKGLDDAELRAVMVGAENSLVMSRTARNMGTEDLQWVRGYGSGTTRKVTSAVEGALRGMSEKMSLLNGQTWWNMRLRYIAGQVQLANIIEDAKKLASGVQLEGHRITEYARFGMSQDDLKEVAGMIAKHGEQNGGLWDPNAQAWDGARGAYLRRRMLTLIDRAAQEAVVAPTAMDIPPFMSKPAGRILMQFQTFGFASVNKYVRNLRYKAVNGQAFDALMSVTWAMATGAAAYAIKEGAIKGNKLTDKPGQWVYESVDRSGLAVWMSPFINAGFKLGAPTMNEMGINWFDVPSRYRAASWYASLLGPSAALGENVFGAMSDLSQGDLAKAGQKASRLVPYQNLFYLEALWRRANGLTE